MLTAELGWKGSLLDVPLQSSFISFPLQSSQLSFGLAVIPEAELPMR